MTAMNTSRNATVSRTSPRVLMKKKPDAPSGSQIGSSAMSKSCQAGVAMTPSNASVLSMRMTNTTRSQPTGGSFKSPTPQGRM